ncbi:NAD(P)H-hydrate dehydratase [Yoonia sp. BS5-3]|uniref:Bifunctional NAD(P)H-hydrate repair enzyme n=1 Tax=Yoonia phaeophyticola TaxID=3137369 RepID=A0ABZ2V194_9RHOB
MTELLTAAQMRAIEKAAIDAGEVTGLELMERAGQGVVDAIFEEWPALRRVGETHRAVVLCGPGNNGGDGFVVARLLKEAGWEVEVFLYGDPKKLPPDAKVNYERWGQTGVTIPLSEIRRSYYQGAGLVIDAFFGTGLARPLPLECSIPIRDAYINQDQPNGPRIVALDVPSGLCADSGFFLHDDDDGRNWIGCHLTVTFHQAKLGHYLERGLTLCARIIKADIGLPPIDRRWVRGKGFVPPLPVALLSSDEKQLAGLGNRLGKAKHKHHKYSHGHALILSGGVGKGGAARLAARGALRIGAGAVTLGAPPAALIENAAQLNAIMLTAFKDADSLTETLQDKRINALCLGPGLGLGAREKELIVAALDQRSPGLDPGPQTQAARRGPGSSPGLRPIVLDADVLTHLAQDDTLFGKLHAKCILTPHAGEFARLFPDFAEKLNAPATKGPAYSKVDATRDAAKRAGCVVLFKGPDTVIADPSGRCSINASVYERSAPWLATAGSGDVLAGFITGLLARGFQPMQAAETGAWLHTECALGFGPGLIAEDIPEELPKVFQKLGV